MVDKKNVIKAIEICYTFGHNCTECPLFPEDDCNDKLMYDVLTLLKEQPEIVQCKDCVHRGEVEKCVLAAIAAEKDFPLFMLDNRGEWYCADGARKEGR